MRAQSNCEFSSPTVALYDGRNPVVAFETLSSAVTYTERAFEDANSDGSPSTRQTHPVDTAPVRAVKAPDAPGQSNLHRLRRVVPPLVRVPTPLEHHFGSSHFLLEILIACA